MRSPFLPYGLSGMMVGAALVFFAFLGFDSVSAHSEEAKQPQRDVPIGIIASLIICTLLYAAVAAVITGMEPYPEIDSEAACDEPGYKAAISTPWRNRIVESAIGREKRVFGLHKSFS